MRAGGSFLAACAVAGAVLFGGCSGADGPATRADPTGGDPVEFCRLVADLNGVDPFAGLGAARTRAEADAIVDAGMARIHPLRASAPDAIDGRTERYVAAFEDFEQLMHDTGYDPDPRDYADLQNRMTMARSDFTTAADEVCGEVAPDPT
jgi:hypothetical protein